jgi:hypothetical protein
MSWRTSELATERRHRHTSPARRDLLAVDALDAGSGERRGTWPLRCAGQVLVFGPGPSCQAIGEENEATSLLVLPGKTGEKKARLASRWLEACGWKTTLIERRHHGDIRVTKDDPPYLLCGLDRVQPRLVMARQGFEFMIDAGLGHGPNDFEGIQLCTIAKGQTANGLWNEGAETKPEEASDKLLGKEAYADLAKQIGRCGIVSFAEASTAVPFVGAAAGALVIAQVIRLASLETTTRFLQIELGAPEMVTHGEFTDAPEANLGSASMTLSPGPQAPQRNTGPCAIRCGVGFEHTTFRL